jgi:hypothetical protein
MRAIESCYTPIVKQALLWSELSKGQAELVGCESLHFVKDGFVGHEV